MSGRPFFCHHDRDGNEYEWKSNASTSGLGPLQLPPNKRKICEGWKVEVARMAKTGAFTWDAPPLDILALRRYQHWLGAEALLALDDFINEKDKGKKAAASSRLKDCLRALKPAKESTTEMGDGR